MAWPSGTVSTTHLDAGTDDPSSARADIKQMADYVNDIIATRGAASGICELDASSQIPTSRGPIPSGTRMVFYQASAPTGWTQVAGLVETYMLRVVASGSSGGGSGGSADPISFAFAHTHSVSGTTGAGGSHTHTLTAGNDIRGGLEATLENLTSDPGTHTHTFSATSGSGGTTFSPRYIDVVVAAKDA